MMKVSILGLFIASLLSCNKSKGNNEKDSIPQSYTVTRPDTDFQMLGVYLWPSSWSPAKRDYDFWKACGYNTVSNLVNGVNASESILSTRSKEISEAHKAGFKAQMLLLSNIGITGHGIDPRDKELMKKRLADIELIVKAISAADFITLVAADPSGSPVPLGEAGADYFLEMVLKVRDIVKTHAPNALFNVNLWAIAHWDHDQISPFSAEFWDKETEYSKRILASPDWGTTGVEFPVHNYYRSLALNEYSKAGRAPELFPDKKQVGELKAKGVKQLWAWPYFLIDEVDDGYTGYYLSSHITQSETRYIRDLIKKLRQLGLNGVMINTSIDKDHLQLEALNMYATGRFCQDATLTAGQVVNEFAGFITDKRSAPVLGKILQFIENHSTWQASLPESYRLPLFSQTYPNAKAALDDLATIRPLSKPVFPLTYTPGDFLSRIKNRLTDIRFKE